MLIRNSIIYMLARLLPGILGMGTTAILTRTLDPARYGIYGLILIVMTFVSAIGFDWLGLCLLRFFQARRNEPGTFATFAHLFAAFVLISGVVAALIWVFDGFILDDAPAYGLGLILAWVYSWFELVAQFEIATLRPLRYLRMSLTRAVLVLIGACGAAWITHDPMWTAALTGIGILAGAAQGSFWGQPLSIRYFNRSLAREIVGYGLPLALTLTMVVLVNNGTRALLEMLDSAKALGLYTAAYVVAQSSLMLIGSSVSSAGYSLAILTLESGDRAGAKRQMSATGTLLLAAIAPSCLGLALTARGFAQIMLGGDFRAAAIALTPWMAAAAFFFCIRSYFFDCAFSLGRRPILLVPIMAVAAISAVGLSFLLIPKMGPVGAAIAVASAMAISCCHSALAGRRIFQLTIDVTAAVRIALCCGFMALIVLSISGTGTLSFLSQVLFGVLGYACAAIALNVLDLRTTLASFLTLHLGRSRTPG